MAAGTSLFSDFTPVPQILNAAMSKRFVARSMELWGSWLGAGANFPIQLLNLPAYGGGQYTENPYLSFVMTANKRDVTSTSALTAQKASGGNNKGVYLWRRSDLMKFSDDVNKGSPITAAQISQKLGEQAGEILADDVSNAVINAMVGFLEAFDSSEHAQTVWVASGDRVNLSPELIEKGRLLMGDRYGALSHLLTRSNSRYDMKIDAYGRAFDAVAGQELAGANGRNGLGLIPAFVDADILTVTDAGFDKYRTILGGPGLLKFGFSQALEFEFDRDITTETKGSYFRADWGLYIQTDHSGWNSGVGGANPAISDLSTIANWTDGFGNHKEVPGVSIVHNYSQN